MTLNPLAWIARKAAGQMRDEMRNMLASPPDWLIQWADGGISATTGSGIVVNEYTAMNFSAVFQAVRILSEAAASLPFPVYKRLEPRGKERVREHPAYVLLDEQPNPDMPAYFFRETMTAHALLWGNAFAEIERTNGGDAIGLHPIHPSRVTPKRLNGGVVYEVTNTGKPNATIAAANMLHIRGLGGDGIIGYSVVRFARETFGLGIATERFGARFFGNGAAVGGWVKVKKTMTPQARVNLRESLNEIHQGVDRSHRIGLLMEDQDFVPATVPPDDAQFLETRKFQVTEVARWFNLPPHKLGDLERSTNNNIEQQSIDFAVHSLRPWLVRWEEEVKLKLLAGEADVFAEHLIDGMLRGDAAARSTYYREQFNIGALSQNDIRELENRNPIDGGDRYFVPLNMIPADKVDEFLEAKNLPGEQTPKAETDRLPMPGEKEPPPPDTKARESHFSAFESAATRFVRRETEKLRTAAKKGDFAGFVTKFYGEHRDYTRDAILPALKAMCGTIEECRSLSPETLAANFAEAHAETAQNELLEASKGAKNSEIQGKIETILTRWESEKPREIAKKAIETGAKSP